MVEEVNVKEILVDLLKRVSRLEAENDQGALSAFLTVLGKQAYESIFLSVEQGVANAFGIDRRCFYDKIISVGNRHGRRGRFLPKDPSCIDDEADKIATARMILYGIVHIDFCVPIVDMTEWYSVSVCNYIREWKVRYLRIFHSDAPMAKNDDHYKRYWEMSYAAIIEECHRNGIYEKLIEELSRVDIDGKVSYIYLNKWRIPTEHEDG